MVLSYIPEAGATNNMKMPESDDASDWSELERKLEELHPYSFGWTLGRCGWNKEEAEEVLQMTYVKNP